jgi:ABC-2 type transport system ATP-binding protein
MIRTEHLTKRYRHTDALQDLNLEVPPGSVFALAGPNGAGKSTALKIVMNLIRPTSGHAEVLGVDSTRLSANEFAQIGYVSENQKLPEWMRVDYFLNYCRELYPAWDGALAEALIRQYRLPLDRRLRTLSRGMKVKAALTASLAYKPRLIVLDEPFSGLDVLVREQLIESLVDCTPESTILLASHDLAEIESFATHVGYLNEGRLEFVEEMATLTQRFREIEVTLNAPLGLPSSLPATWLNAEESGPVVRFTDTSYEPNRSREEVSRRFEGIRNVQSREMSFRAIFLALAKSRREQCA